MANHYVRCIIEDLAKHIRLLSLSDEQKSHYLYNVSVWGNDFDAPSRQVNCPAGQTPPEKAEMLPLFLELAKLAEETGNDSLKGALYHAVTVELSDELEEKFDESWLPVISELQTLLFHDPIMERAYGEFAGYEDELLEYGEEYKEQAPHLCDWTKYFCDWCVKRRRAEKPRGKAPSEIIDQLEKSLEAWEKYVTVYPYNVDGCRFLAGELALLIEKSLTMQSRYVNMLLGILQAHPGDAYIQHQYMRSLTAPTKTGALPLTAMEAQHPVLRQIADAFATNPDVQAEYAHFLQLMEAKSHAENQL